MPSACRETSRMRARTRLRWVTWAICRVRDSRENHLASWGKRCSPAFLTVKGRHLLTLHLQEEALFSIRRTDDALLCFIHPFPETWAERGSERAVQSAPRLLNNAYRGNTKQQMNRYFSAPHALHGNCIHHTQVMLETASLGKAASDLKKWNISEWRTAPFIREPKDICACSISGPLRSELSSLLISCKGHIQTTNAHEDLWFRTFSNLHVDHS